MTEMIGTKLDRFELIAELASGGMGTVFLARLGGAGGFQRLYAIKRLHEHLARHSEFIEMFLDEARLAARIHHPNVVPILEIGTNDAGYYLVMEYVEGDTAGHLFHVASQEKKPVSPRIALRIALDVLAGLHAAHEGTDDEGRLLEVVHRDVSPHNILVSVEGVSRITDFGIARAASRLAVTRTGQLKGKIAYMAPEQARSEKIDRRADLFAMGICLWEMLAGRRLFKAEAEGDTLNRLLYEPIPSLRSVDPGMSPEIDAVCAMALTRDLSKRFATAAEFSDALETAARAGAGVASHREVAACIADLLGADLSERRADLRAWLIDTERKTVVPPTDSSGDLGLARRGAHVSVYVPSLFDSGSLGPHAGSDPARPPTKGGRKKVALVVALALAASLSVVKFWRGHSTPVSPPTVTQGAPTSTSLTTNAPADPHAASEPVPVDENAIPVASASAMASPGEAAMPSAPALSVHAAPVAAPQHVTVVAAIRPVHPTNGVSTPPEGGPASRPGASSVPRDMLDNPYR